MGGACARNRMRPGLFRHLINDRTLLYQHAAEHLHRIGRCRAWSPMSPPWNARSHLPDQADAEA